MTQVECGMGIIAAGMAVPVGPRPRSWAVSGRWMPAVHFGGWYDVFQQGTIDGFVSRHKRGGPGARGTQKLIIGPWGHGGPKRRPCGELTFPDNQLHTPYACGADQWRAAER